jgi:hypothetical protein
MGKFKKNNSPFRYNKSLNLEFYISILKFFYSISVIININYPKDRETMFSKLLLKIYIEVFSYFKFVLIRPDSIGNELL